METIFQDQDLIAAFSQKRRLFWIYIAVAAVFAALLIGTYTQQMSMVKMSLAHALGQGFGVELPKEQWAPLSGRETVWLRIPPESILPLRG